MNRRRRTATSRRDLIRDAVFSVVFAVLVVMVAKTLWQLLL
jgi:hypothetical protein